MDPIDELLARRVEKILPEREGLKSLMEKRKIRLYQGFDPTISRLHLGHAIGLRKLMEFANLGNEVIFLFGTGTVLVGDPSQRESGRKLITQEEIDENIKTWKKQVQPIVDFSKVTIKHNADWLVPLTLKDLITIASKISAVQLFKRESFQNRIKRGNTIWYHETMYPLLQGYDSVVMDVDLEIGGTDQEFNMLVGRELMRKMRNKEKFVLTVPLLMGTDGEKMSKSRGNCIWLNDSPAEMYGKLMRLPDTQIIPYMELVTDIPLEEIRDLPQDPLANKKRLAFAVVSTFHDSLTANAAAEEFSKVVQEKGVPKEVPTFPIRNLPQNASLVDILSVTHLVATRSQAKRLVQQGGVEVNGERVTDAMDRPQLQPGMIIRAGKRNFIRFTD